MVRRSIYVLVLAVSWAFAASPAAAQEAADDLNGKIEKAMQDAIQKVAPSVVQIVTQGGTDMVVISAKGPAFRKALGPTTGLVVGSDGWIISSAFNFINKPTAVFVAVPGHPEPYVAKQVATDRSRMLTLLKIEATGLPVPAAVPKKELQVGQWSIALGRTLDSKRDQPPSVSVGIISALSRIWGRAIQVDAKISPINYGGPVIDIQGRVQGVLVPASPKSEDDTAGFEWYDSGIGFAIPLDDINAVLPRLQKGKDLRKGLLGIRPKSGDIYGAAPEVAEVIRDSAAHNAGLQPGDVLVEIDGQAVVRMAQVLHILGAKYEGDKIALKYRRGDKIVAVPALELAGELTVIAHPFLGILPMRDDPRLGVEVRYVFPKSPAEKAGLKPGDRIVKVGIGKSPPRPFSGVKRGRDELFDLLNAVPPGTELKLEVTRKEGKSETVSAVLEPMPGTAAKQEENLIPKELPRPASHKTALAPLEVGPKKFKLPKGAPPKAAPPKAPLAKKDAATGIIKRQSPEGHRYWAYVPEDYDPNIAHALVIWLHPPTQTKDEEFEDFIGLWEEYCAANDLILLLPRSESDAGWLPSEAESIRKAVGEMLGQYSIDRQRVVAHGLGVGGQMALYFGTHARDLVRGIATVGAVPTHFKDNLADQRLSFYLAAGDRDPLAKAVAEARTKLVEHKLPVIFRQIPNRGREYLDTACMEELVRWIDSLDRQ